MYSFIYIIITEMLNNYNDHRLTVLLPVPKSHCRNSILYIHKPKAGIAAQGNYKAM
jgi:hypothetical protein